MVDKPDGQRPAGQGSTGQGAAARPPRGDAAARSALARDLFAQLKATAPGSAALPVPTAKPGGPPPLGVQPANIGGIRVVGPAAQAQAKAQAQSQAQAQMRAAVTPPRPAARPAVRTRSRLRFRLLPLTIFLLVLMLGVRVVDSWRVLTRGGTLPDVPALQAQTPPAGKDAGKEPGKEPGKDAGKETGKEPDVAAIGRPKPETVDVELIKHLSERREELEKRSKALDQREALMVITEKRLDQKMAELNGVRGEIQTLLKQVDDKQKAQLESLVRIYETMKPKDAARIFEQLEPDILLGVVERMKEAKTAPILAAMDPLKAKDLTTRLAEQRRLPTVPQ